MALIKYGTGRKYGAGWKYGQAIGSVVEESLSLTAVSGLAEGGIAAFPGIAALLAASALDVLSVLVSESHMVLNAASAFNTLPGTISWGALSLGASADLQTDGKTLIDKMLFLNASGQLNPGEQAALHAALAMILTSGLSAEDPPGTPDPILDGGLALEIAAPGVTAVANTRKLALRPQSSGIKVICDG